MVERRQNGSSPSRHSFQVNRPDEVRRDCYRPVAWTATHCRFNLCTVILQKASRLFAGNGHEALATL